jgi:N4-gp56 family major capsid protein
MALTDLTNQDVALPEIWAKDLLIEAEKRMFWTDYEGSQGSGMPIIRKDELNKAPGDTIRIITMSNLTGSGQTGDTANLTGNEEALSIDEIVVNLGIKAHAVKFTKYANQQSVVELRTASKMRLAYWVADRLDQSAFVTLTGSATFNLYGGTATTDGTLATGDAFDTTALNKIKAKLVDNRALPIKIDDGEEWFITVIHPFNGYDLRADADWQEAQREANVRGRNNPIFSGALGVYNGMIVRESHNVPFSNVNSTSGGEGGIGTGTVNVSYPVAFGGEAMARAYGQYPSFLEEFKDYGRKHGVGTDVVFGDKIAVQSNLVVGHYWAEDPNA